MAKLNFIDVFSGAGGLSCGLEMTGMKCILGIDSDKAAIETFKRNHKYAQTFCGDVTKLTTRKLKKLVGDKTVDVVVGGPPCQGFSTVGPGNPKDSRNKLFMQFVKIVKETMPSFIVIENVTGMVAKKNEQTLKAIFKQFNSLGFYMDVRVLSADEYGVPEKRRRTILIGSKITSQIIYPRKTHNIQKGKKFIPASTVKDALNNIANKKGEVFNHNLELAQIKDKTDKKRLNYIPEGRGIRYERDEREFLPKRLRLHINWEEIPEKRFRQTKYFRLDRNAPSPTIMTHRHSYYHPVECRYLTAREAAAIQSFPNNFIFEGTISSQWRQIGNAVPPLLGRAIGKAILKMYKSSNQNSKTIEINKIKQIKQSISEIREKAFLYKC